MKRIGFFTSVDFGKFGGARQGSIANFTALKEDFDVDFLNFKIINTGESGIDEHQSLSVDVGVPLVNEALTISRSVLFGKRSDYDLFYFYMSSGGSAMIAYLLGLVDDRPYIIGVKDFIELKEDTAINRFIRRYIRPRVLEKGDGIAALDNKEMIEEIIEITEDEDKIHIIPNSIDINEFIYDPSQNEKPKVFYVGRKNDIDLFLESARRIHEEDEEKAEFVIAGIDSYEFPDYEFINFLGRIPDEDQKRQLARSDICVIPYSNEKTAGVPIKTLEYMASGCCIVATDLPFNRATLEDRETALLADPTVEDFSEELREAINNPDLRQELNENARREVKRYSHRIVAEKLREVIKSVTN